MCAVPMDTVPNVGSVASVWRSLVYESVRADMNGMMKRQRATIDMFLTLSLRDRRVIHRRRQFQSNTDG